MLAQTDHAVHVLLCLARIDHLSQDFSSSPVVGILVLMCRELLLEFDNALRLLHDDGSTQLLRQVLTFNLDLLTTTFATGLEKVGAATLHGCDK